MNHPLPTAWQLHVFVKTFDYCLPWVYAIDESPQDGPK